MSIFQNAVEFIVRLISGFATKEIAFEFAFLILISGILVWVIFILRPHIAFTRNIRSATAKIATARRQQDLKAADRIASVDKAMKSNSILAEVWAPYRGALRVDPKTPDGFVNPIDPHSWFSVERLPGRGYEKWATTMAGVSLTVGLLFTFVGLSAALFKVGEAGADTAQLRLAIAEILQISSAKFITSMAGIIAFIGWTLVARSYTSTQMRLAGRLASGVQSLSFPITPEALLLDQLEETKAQTTQLKTLATDMAVAFDKSLTNVIGQRLDSLPTAVGAVLQPALERSVQPVIDAIQGIGGTIGQGNHAALEKMITDLTSGVKDATGQEMSMLVESMKDAADELKAAKSGIGVGGVEFGLVLARAAEGMNVSATRMAQAMETRAGEIDDRMQKIEEALSSGASKFDNMGNSMSVQMEAGLQAAMDTIAAAATAGASRAREHAQAELSPLLSELKGLMNQIKASAEDSRGALVEGGRAAAGHLDTALANVGRELSGSSIQASKVLVDSFEVSTSQMVAAIEGALVGYRTATESLAARLTVIEQGFSALEQSVRRQVGLLDETGVALTNAGKTVGAASTQISQVTAPILSSLQSLEGAATSSRDTLQLVRDTGAAMKETVSAMSAASESAVQAFRSYEGRFVGVDASLGQTLAKLRDGVIELGSSVTEVVTKNDEQIARAIGALRSGVSELNESIESLGDKLAAVN